MQVGVINLSQDPTVAPKLEEIAAALEEQSFNDVAPFRQTAGVPCKYYPNATAQVDVASGAVTTTGLPDGCSPHLVLDYPQDQGELGDHYATDQGLPILRSFWGPTRDSGGDLTGPQGLSITMSHEHIEASEDPYADRWNDRPDGQTEEADEACDRCEIFSYKRDGSNVYVSDFLSPRAMRPGPGPYDFMGMLKNWDDLLPGCYVILRTGGPAGTVTPTFGENYPTHKLALKMLRTSKASRRGIVWMPSHRDLATTLPWAKKALSLPPAAPSTEKSS
jgi:hypothetical protein